MSRRDSLASMGKDGQSIFLDYKDGIRAVRQKVHSMVDYMAEERLYNYRQFR